MSFGRNTRKLKPSEFFFHYLRPLSLSHFPSRQTSSFLHSEKYKDYPNSAFRCLGTSHCRETSFVFHECWYYRLSPLSLYPCGPHRHKEWKLTKDGQQNFLICNSRSFLHFALIRANIGQLQIRHVYRRVTRRDVVTREMHSSLQVWVVVIVNLVSRIQNNLKQKQNQSRR